ncbi:hypothetical protein ACYZT2_07485 [Pseudomonas sp. MDT1-85]
MAHNLSDPGVLVLWPLKFAGGISPVISDPVPPPGVPVEGLPHSAFTVVVQKDGSREGTTPARIDPLLEQYEAITLYMKTHVDPPLLIERKVSTDPNAPLIFNVAQSLFLEGLNIFYYVVERASGNTKPSTPSWALYNHNLPGGNDIPGNGDHPFLTLSLPAELGSPPQIGKDEAASGVPLTVDYPYGQPYDKILLTLNGVRFPFTLQPAEQNKPYVITLTQAMFERAGNNARFDIRYTVISQVNNPTDKRRESSAITADVNLDRLTLDAPILREDPDDTSDDPGIIDRDKLKGRPLLVVVVPRTPPFQAGDTVKGVMTITPPGSELPLTGTIESDGFGQLKPCIMEVANDQIITDSEVRAFVELVRGGQVIGHSKDAVAQVIGSDELPGEGEIAAPAFPVLNENSAIGLNELISGPEGLHNPIRITLDYIHAAVGDLIELFFVGYDALNTGGNLVPGAAYNPQPPYTLVQADLSRGYYEFRVPARHHFAVCSHGRVEAHVIVSNAAGSTTSYKKPVNCDVKKPGDTDCPGQLLRQTGVTL